jgi:hypothetical protein
MCPTAPNGLWTTGIKKSLATLGTQIGSRVYKARSCVNEAPEDMHAATVHPYSAASAQLTTPEHGYSGDDPTVRHHGTGHVQCNRTIRRDDSTLLTPCKTSFATPSH